MGELFSSICSVLNCIWQQYIISPEGLATILVLVAIVLKLFVNCAVTSLHLKKTAVSIPSEITFLVLGFLMSTILNNSNSDKLNHFLGVGLIAFVVLIVQYALERYLENKLSGTLKGRYRIVILGMFIASCVLYFVVVLKGRVG